MSILLADGFEDAFIGIMSQFGAPPCAAYDYKKALEILVSRDGMDTLEADEFMQFNVLGAYVGDTTPVWINRTTLDDLMLDIDAGLYDE